jgi:hypothetical protein
MALKEFGSPKRWEKVPHGTFVNNASTGKIMTRLAITATAPVALSTFRCIINDFSLCPAKTGLRE